MKNYYEVSSNEFPYFDAVRRLELFFKRRRRENKKEQHIDETPLTPSEERIANEGRITIDKEYIVSQLLLGLEEALTGLKGHEVGQLMRETATQKDGTSWRHNLAYKTKDHRLDMLKRLTDHDLQRWRGDIQTFEFILHVFEDQLDKEQDIRREKREFLMSNNSCP
jgi:hypothetical protein